MLKLPFGITLYSLGEAIANPGIVFLGQSPEPVEEPRPTPAWERKRMSRSTAEHLLEDALSFAASIKHPGERARFIEQMQDEYSERLRHIAEDM